MKKRFVLIFAAGLFFLFPAFGCNRGGEPEEEEKDTPARCVISSEVATLAQGLLGKENLRLVWESNETDSVTQARFTWEYAVQSLGTGGAQFREKIYRFTDPNGRTKIYHFSESERVACYQRANPSANWTKYETTYPANVESEMVELLREGMLNLQNMGKLCETKYFWKHSVKVKLFGIDCQKLTQQENENVVLYLTPDNLCLKWENLQNAAVGGRVTEYGQNVSIPIPIVSD